MLCNAGARPGRGRGKLQRQPAVYSRGLQALPMPRNPPKSRNFAAAQVGVLREGEVLEELRARDLEAGGALKDAGGAGGRAGWRGAGPLTRAAWLR